MELSQRLHVGQPVTWLTGAGRRVSGVVSKVGADQVQVAVRATRGIRVKRWVPFRSLSRFASDQPSDRASAGQRPTKADAERDLAR
jgi:hypothetical protein